MKRAERSLYLLRRTKDEDRVPADNALAFECRTAATFDRHRIGHLARRLALDAIAPGLVAFCFASGSSGAVLFIGHMLHPVDDLAVERFCNRDVRHRCGRSRAMPVFLARWEPDDIARPYLLNRSALALREAAAGRHD
jgi:hypothetical protein